MIIGDLTSAHIGRTITIKAGRGTATDQLQRVEHGGEIDELQAWANAHLRTHVNGNTTVTLRTFGVHDLPSNAEIIVEEAPDESVL